MPSTELSWQHSNHRSTFHAERRLRMPEGQGYRQANVSVRGQLPCWSVTCQEQMGIHRAPALMVVVKRYRSMVPDRD